MIDEDVPDVFGEQVDVVLRPSVRVAQAAGLVEAWGGEIVLPAVRVERPQPSR